jgi:hypothetical protein
MPSDRDLNLRYLRAEMELARRFLVEDHRAKRYALKLRRQDQAAGRRQEARRIALSFEKCNSRCPGI